jgi:hypothetical protein
MFPEPDGDLGARGARQLAQNIAHVGLHVLADLQCLGDLPVALAGGDLLCDLLLPRREVLPTLPQV